MARRSLRTSLTAFVRNVDECKQLAADAYSWSIPVGSKRAMISRKRRDSMVELAFLRAFLAWETFLEETFILYLAGQKPPKGRAPARYAFPPNVTVAGEWVVPEGRDYANWTRADRVTVRAERFFKNGIPYAPVLRSNQNTLNDTRVLRNAIAHASVSTQAKFENLVRNKLAAYPTGLTVGGFLSTTVPHTTPPISFLEDYFAKFEAAALLIVRK